MCSLNHLLSCGNRHVTTLLQNKLSEAALTSLMSKLNDAQGEAERTKLLKGALSLRPDLMIIQPCHSSKRYSNTTHSSPRLCTASESASPKFSIIEVGYCREGRGLEKKSQKGSQHELLKHLLQHAYSEQGANSEILTVTLGVSGAIYDDSWKTMARLGMRNRHTLVKKLVMNAHNGTHAMVVRRRQLDRRTLVGDFAPQIHNRAPKRKRPPDK